MNIKEKRNQENKNGELGASRGHICDRGNLIFKIFFQFLTPFLQVEIKFCVLAKNTFFLTILVTLAFMFKWNFKNIIRVYCLFCIGIMNIFELKIIFSQSKSKKEIGYKSTDRLLIGSAVDIISISAADLRTDCTTLRKMFTFRKKNEIKSSLSLQCQQNKYYFLLNQTCGKFSSQKEK